MSLTPKEIVTELDKYIIGQNEAKKAVAIALRNRYRRSQLPKEMLNSYIYINFADNSVGGILSRADGSQNGGLYGLNCLSTSTEMSEWYFNITVNNYQSYIDYTENNNKIKLTLTFYDNGLNSTQDVVQKDIYFIPKITEVAKTTSSQYNITAKSGSKLNFDINNYSIVFVDNKTPVGIANNFIIVHYNLS